MGNWMRAGVLLVVALLGVNAAPGEITDVVASLNSKIQHGDQKIIAGVAVTIDKYQYQLAMLINGEFACGGSIISLFWALTAAHCTTGDASTYSLRAGSSDRTAGGKIHYVIKKISHENYDASNHDNDVSLLQVSESFSSTAIIPLIPKGTFIKAGTRVTVSGWGTTFPVIGPTTQYLQSVTIPVVTEFRCQMAYLNQITKRMICTGYIYGLFDSCQGDSGGPLVATVGGVTQLVGVVSFGFYCGLPLIPGVYARVSEFRDWIQTNAGV